MIDTGLPNRFCLNCKYPLDGLAHHECPECGQAFDPANPNSYAVHRHVHERLTEALGTLSGMPRRLVLAGALVAMVLIWPAVVAVVAFLGLRGLEHVGAILCVMILLFPLWLIAAVLLWIALCQNDRIHGLLFNIAVGMVGGALLPFALLWWSSPLMVVFGLGVGLVAGLVYEYYTNTPLAR